MKTAETATSRPGLRERKKQQTRETIERVALKLFAERGFDETTVADIAEAADVSARTIFSYFDSKEAILFCEESSSFERLKEMLEQRPPGMTTADAMREFLSSVGPHDEAALLRKKVLMANPALGVRMRARFESLLQESIAKDLGGGADDIRSRLIAASINAAFTTMREQLEAGDEPNHEQVMRTLDEVLEFLRGGLAALESAQPTQPSFSNTSR
jgi:AcrR family transcriptional regulator